jgi:uncharacterized protein involved in type VI secretion and phage assembly
MSELILDRHEGQVEEAGLIKGVAVGVVTQNRDPDSLGRVKVKFPWRENPDESHWARIAAPMAGVNRGTWFLPEVGDEVLVAFEAENVEHPYLLGALWNGQDNPPETNQDGQNNIRKIRSRSGHEIIFNDDSQTKKEKIEVHTNGGHKIVLDDSLGSEKIEVKDRAGTNFIVIDSVQNSLTIESGLSLTIKSTNINIEASATMTLKAGAILTIQGTLVKIN